MLFCLRSLSRFINSTSGLVLSLLTLLALPQGQAIGQPQNQTLGLAAVTIQPLTNVTNGAPSRRSDPAGSASLNTGSSVATHPQRLARRLTKADQHAPRQHRPMAAIDRQYRRSRNVPKALYWQLQALKNAQEAQDTTRIANALLAISTNYYSLTDHNQALRYAQKAHQLARQTVNQRDHTAPLLLIGNSYRSLGHYAEAMAVYQQLLTDRMVTPGQRVAVMSALAATYEQTGNFPLTFRYALNTLDSARYYRDSNSLSLAYLTLSRAYEKTYQAPQALYYGEKAFKLAQALHNPEGLRDASQVLAHLHAQRQDFDQAYMYQNRFLVLKDSLEHKETTLKLTAAHFSAQLNRQQSRIALLMKDKQLHAEEARRQRELFYGTLVVLTLIGGVLALLYRNNRQKQRANTLLHQQKEEIQHQRDQIHQALAELKTTQAQLIHSEKMASLGELTAGIAHEIQNPLNFVTNFSEVSRELIEELTEELQQGNLQDVALLANDLSVNLEKIEQHSKRASGIVRGMLEHSRSSKGTMEPTHLNAFVDEHLRLAYHGLRAQDKTFSCEMETQWDDSIDQVEVMPAEMGRVLLNLFSNAFYAVRDQQRQRGSGYRPRVQVQTRQRDERIEIWVQDNGTGMAESIQAKIFQPFFTTKPTGQGTGLGLSLSYDIVTKGHGGSLNVTSQEGQGAEFVISLPLDKVGCLQGLA